LNAVAQAVHEAVFRFTAKQEEAQDVCTSEATHCMLFGGSRSGKTFLIVRNIVARALKAPGSRHLICRFRFNHLKSSIILDTFPNVMRKCFPQVKYNLSKSDWYVTLPNGSEIWFAGLDDKERLEKILGKEYVTIYPNECSQIAWDSIQVLITRLGQKVMQVVKGMKEQLLKLRMYYDCNPPTKAHWTFRVFKQKLDPETKLPLTQPKDYACFQMNPIDNQENLSPEYMRMLSQLSARMQRRFKDGEFGEAAPGALFDESIIDRWRVLDSNVPQLVRLVVAVDPSGSGDVDNADNDEIGVAVGGLGVDGRAYFIEDLSLKAGPATWGRTAVTAYGRHKADVVVGETNFGGDMVRATIQTAAAAEGMKVNFKKVTASRGKHVRAEPFSALYEQGKVRHVGMQPKLEDELCGMTTTGYTGTGSPNRADAWIWVLAELFPAVVSQKQSTKNAAPIPVVSHFNTRN
jgi:predicted phage terminase large subunit-like protein